MIKDYRPVRDFPGWNKNADFMKGIIKKHSAKSILEIGAGANPTLSAEYVKSQKLLYTTNDSSFDELEKANDIYDKLVCDFCSTELDNSLHSSFDLIFSRMVNEHIKNGKLYYENIFKMLKHGGVTVHCFSTLYTSPFIINRLAPEYLTDILLNTFSPRDYNDQGKFKAYYSWSRGPSNRMIKNYISLGYQIFEYVGFFGHGYYKKKLKFFHLLESVKSSLLLRFPLHFLTSYAYIILKKP